MAKLAVSIDQIGSLRQSRKTRFPDPAAAAILAELAGADGILARIGKDHGNVDQYDVQVLSRVVQTRLILKITPSTAMIGFALDAKPNMVILVSEKKDKFAMESGLDLVVHRNAVAQIVESLQSSGIAVCILIDPNPDQVKLAHGIDASKVQIHTGNFCRETSPKKKDRELSRIVDSVKLAHKLKLGVCAGNGLCYRTIEAFKGLGEIEAFHIGHGIISRAVLVGIERAVSEMLFLVRDI